VSNEWSQCRVVADCDRRESARSSEAGWRPQPALAPFDSNGPFYSISVVPRLLQENNGFGNQRIFAVRSIRFIPNPLSCSSIAGPTHKHPTTLARDAGRWRIGLHLAMQTERGGEQ